MEGTSRRHRTSFRQPAVLAWLRLARVFQKIDTHSERFFRRHRLNTAQFDVLAHVGAASGMTQQELADALLVTKGNISQLLAKLEQDSDYAATRGPHQLFVVNRSRACTVRAGRAAAGSVDCRAARAAVG